MQVETNGGLEERLSTLQAQIEHLRRTSISDPRVVEQRLARLTDVGAEILKRWSATADRHAAAVSQFEAHLRELSDAGTQLQKDASQRIADLERVIQQEWDALRHLHEAPVKQLVDQAANLTEVCVATANSAQQGFDRAETRLAAIETDFQRNASELTREIRTVLAELRNLSPVTQRQLAEPPSWPLDDVTRLHRQLRERQDTDGAAVRALPESSLRADARPAASAESANNVADDQPRVAASEAPGGGRLARAALAAGVVLLVAAGVFVWRLERDVRASAARVDESQRQLRLAADAASRQLAQKQDEAARELAAAQQLATRAQTIGDVLAAPDLIRYPLQGRDALAAASGQMLWSRSRGFVFSASGMPAPPDNATYQMWLLVRGGAVSGGTFLPDAGGRVTLADAPKVPPPMLGAIVTMERKGGSDTPSGEPLLARAPLPPPGS
jgi:anti-sigma-K factor RskA